MTFGKSLSKTRHLSLSLLAGLMAACGSDTPAFQERAMSALLNEQGKVSTFSSESSDNSADATAASGDSMSEHDVDFNTIETVVDRLNENSASDLTIDVKESQLRFGSQTTSISTSVAGEKFTDVTYVVIAPAGKDPGKIINGNTYVSPSAGNEAYEVKIVAISKSDPNQSSSTVLKLEPAAQVFVGCTNDMKGFPIKADVFEISDQSKKLPDFSMLAEKKLTACMDAFQIPNRAWSDGFPGHPKLIEWFAVRASSHLTISKSGKHYFKLNADDGAKLYIDGQLVVDNDGLHAEKAVVGSMNLDAGDHELVIEYFQGPRYHIALELFWKIPGSSAYTYVPSSAFKP